MSILLRRRPVEFRIADEPADDLPELRAISFRPLPSTEPVVLGTPPGEPGQHPAPSTPVRPRAGLRRRGARWSPRRRARPPARSAARAVSPARPPAVERSWDDPPAAIWAATASVGAPPLADGEDPAALAFASALDLRAVTAAGLVADRARPARPVARRATTAVAASALAVWALMTHGGGRTTDPAAEPPRPLPGLASAPHRPPASAQPGRTPSQAGRDGSRTHRDRSRARRTRSREPRHPRRPVPARAARRRAARTAPAAAAQARRLPAPPSVAPATPRAHAAARPTASPAPRTTASSSSSEFGFEGTR